MVSDSEPSGGDSNDQENNNRVVSGKRKKYEISLKLEAIDYAKKHSKKAAASHYKVSRSCIIDWINKEHLLRETMSVSKKAKRLSGAGRKVADPALDAALLSWIKCQRQKGLRVSRRQVKNKALALKCDDSAFTASNGWLQCFLKRHKLVHRKVTTVAQKPPQDYEKVIAQYLYHIMVRRKEENYKHLYSCDETAVYVEAQDSTTISEKGVKDVPITVSGNSKFRLTVLLTARNDGHKLKPFVLIPRKRPVQKIAQEFRSKLELHWGGGSWMNNDNTSAYLQSAFGQNLFSVKRCLIWDSFSAHKSQATTDKLRELKMDSIIIPGGCTSFLQPPDTHWNKVFKSFFKQKYEDWAIEGEKEKTKSGNTKGPPMELYLQWIVDAWAQLSSDYIRKSFLECGITANVDGSEDDQILCIRKHVPNVLGMLKDLRQTGIDDLADQINALDFEEEDSQQKDSDQDQEEESAEYDSDAELEFITFCQD